MKLSPLICISILFSDFLFSYSLVIFFSIETIIILLVC